VVDSLLSYSFDFSPLMWNPVATVIPVTLLTVVLDCLKRRNLRIPLLLLMLALDVFFMVLPSLLCNEASENEADEEELAATASDESQSFEILALLLDATICLACSSMDNVYLEQLLFLFMLLDSFGLEMMEWEDTEVTRDDCRCIDIISF